MLEVLKKFSGKLLLIFFVVCLCEISLGIESQSKVEQELILKNQEQAKEIDSLKKDLTQLKEKNVIRVKDDTSGTFVYNVDQVYENAVSFYDKAIGNFFKLISIIGAILIALLGFLQIRNDKKIKEEVKDIKNDFEKQTEDLKNDFNKRKLEIEKELASLRRVLNVQNIKITEENKNIKEETLSMKLEAEKILSTSRLEIGAIQEKLDNELAEVNKSSKEFKENLEKIKIDSKKLTEDIKKMEFNLELGLAISKNERSEKIEELKDMEKNIEKYTLNQKCELYFRIAYWSEDEDEKIEYYTKSINLIADPADYNNRGNIYHDKGKYDRAIEDYSNAIKIYDKSELYFCNRGNTYLEMWEKENADWKLKNAISDFEKALMIKTDFDRAELLLKDAQKKLKAAEEKK